MISTRGRYALRMLLDLSQRDPEKWVSLDSIASSQQISKKYLESIMKILVSDGFVQGLRGKGGGYRLTRAPEEILVGDVLRSAEGGLASVSCLKDPDYKCPRRESCKTLGLWKKFDQLVSDFFDGITLRDLRDQNF